MAESICRALRDGVQEGEHAPALTIKDSVNSPFGPLVFNHVLSQLSSNILAGKSQSKGLVLVALSRSPSFYADLLKIRANGGTSSSKWIRVLDCYSDPLGWKEKLMENGSITNPSSDTPLFASLCKNVGNLNDLFRSIIELGKELIAEGKGRFSVAIDSISEMLRHASMSSVACLLSNLRSHEQVSCVFWVLHSDLHETRATPVLEYLSSMMASIEPVTLPISVHRERYENISSLEHNFRRGKFQVRAKRRNGRVRVMCEELFVEQSGLKFSSVSSQDGVVSQTLVPKVQFNLQLSEKEQLDRAKVVLPFEHQEITKQMQKFGNNSILFLEFCSGNLGEGNGKSIQIYDGRKPLNEGKAEATLASDEKSRTNDDSRRGEIIYFRDSDDERPDSDEDPDDDLDI